MYHVIDRSILFPLALCTLLIITSSTLLGSFCNTPKKPCRKRKRESLSGMDYKIHLRKVKSSSIFLTLLKPNTSSNEPVIIKVALKPFNICALSLQQKLFKLNCN